MVRWWVGCFCFSGDICNANGSPFLHVLTGMGCDGQWQQQQPQLLLLLNCSDGGAYLRNSRGGWLVDVEDKKTDAHTFGMKQ